MTDKQINRWLCRQFTVIGWVLVAYYMVMNLLASLAMAYEAVKQSLWAFALGEFSGNLNWDAMAGNAWGYIAAIAVSFVILLGWKGKAYWKKEVFAKNQPMVSGVMLCMLCFCTGAQMLNGIWVSGLELIMNGFGRSLMPLLQSVSGDSDTLSMFVYVAILAPISEELIFRGYVLRSLRPYGKRFAIWGSALLFGLFHGNLLQAPYALIIGLVLGYVAVEYSINWAILIHMFNNLVLAELMTRLTINLPILVQTILNTGLSGGCLVLSTGILVLNYREIRDYRRSEWMDRRVLKCFFSNSGIAVLTVLMLVNMVLVMFV